MRFNRLRLAALVTSLAAVATGLPPSTADGPRPGLPAHTGPGGWVYFIQGGATEAKKAKQWVRVPMQLSTGFSRPETFRPGPTDPWNQWAVITNWLYLISEDGAPHNYGLSAPFTVRTAAFGSIPVTATLRMAQRRTADGLPIPLMIIGEEELYRLDNPRRPADWGAATTRTVDTEMEERLNVQVTALSVDGVDVGLKPGCQTESPAKLHLFGQGYLRGTPGIDHSALWESGHFALAAGGLLSGTVDMPSLAGCRAATGEDLSPLLTAAVSGPDNAVALHANVSTCGDNPLPPHPGTYNAPALCPESLPGPVSLPPTPPTQ